MNLSIHYDSYRREVQYDAFADFQNVAAVTPTADPGQFPTVIDYLKYATGQIKRAVEANDCPSYKTALGNHREGIFALLQMMFEREVASIPKLREPAILDVVHKYGWRSLKFASTALEFDSFTIVPRYTWQFKGVCDVEVCLNADEMAKIMHANPPEAQLRKIMAIKEEGGYITTVVDGIETWVPMAKRNVDTVCDWSGDLQ